jgi:hypothetical protein
MIFKISLPRAKKICSGQRNLCQVFFSFPRVFYLALGKEASVPSVFLCQEFFISLSAKPCLPRVFYFALGTETNSRQSLGFW